MLGSGISIEVADAVIEVLGEEGDAAVVRLTGTLSTDVMGLVDEEAIDVELTVVREDGEWLVCDDLPEPSGDGGPDLSLGLASDEGVCATVTLDELNALGALQYDSSFVGFESCTYLSSSIGQGLPLVTVYLRGGDLEEVKQSFPGGDETSILGHAAYGQGSQLWVELPEGVLEVAPELFGDPGIEGFDPLAYAAQIAEIAIPRVPDVEVEDLGGFVSPPPAEPDASALDLCQAMTLDALNGLSPLQFDLVEGGPDFCNYSATDFASGLHYVSTSLTPGTVDEFKLYFPDGEAVEVAGRPAYWALEQLWVQLDEGVLAVSAYLTGSPAAEGLSSLDFASVVAALILERLPGQE
jgi:hypothetical protein